MNKLDKMQRFKLLQITDSFRATVDFARTAIGKPPLNQYLNERLVYSFLVFRSRQSQGATINEIARETRLHKLTINKTLANLAALVHQHDGKWHCNEPGEGLFTPLPDPRSIKHWSDRFCYLNYYPPSAKATLNGKRFGVKHAVVLSVIISYAKQSNPNSRLSIQLISRLTEIGRKTVSSIFDDLLRAGLIDYRQSGLRLKLDDSHYLLFEQKKDPPAAAKEDAAARVLLGKYEYKQDGFDELRRLCEPLFAQRYAEQAIVLGGHLKLSATEFDDALRAAKRASDENIKSGKCSYPNLGQFFVNRLQRQWDEKMRIEVEAEKERQRQAYLNSNEYREKRKREEEIAEADPTHPLHTVDADSITARVHLDACHTQATRLAQNTLRRVGEHCKHFVSKQHLPTQKSVDLRGTLQRRIVGQALKRLNHHYGNDTKATRQELEAAIDGEASEIPGLGSVFNKS